MKIIRLFVLYDVDGTNFTAMFVSNQIQPVKAELNKYVKEMIRYRGCKIPFDEDNDTGYIIAFNPRQDEDEEYIIASKATEDDVLGYKIEELIIEDNYLHELTYQKED